MSPRVHRARQAVVVLLDGLGICLIVMAAWLVAPALGLLAAGVIALSLAVVVSPPGGQATDEGDDEAEADT